MYNVFTRGILVIFNTVFEIASSELPVLFIHDIRQERTILITLDSKNNHRCLQCYQLSSEVELHIIFVIPRIRL